MNTLWSDVDGLLRNRGRFSSDEALRQLRARRMAAAVLLLGASYGFFMGWYAVFGWPQPEYRQMLSSALKVPALFLLTLFVCFPSLYVFSTLAGSRFSLPEILKLLLAITVISVTVLASFGPIVAFFALSTDSHPFMKLLNVAILAVSGLFGAATLFSALRSLLQVQPPVAPPLRETEQSDAVPPLVAPPLLVPRIQPRDPAKSIFRIWILIYAVVGAQMSWILRPFIGAPGERFHWFSPRESNFFIDVWEAIWKLLS